MLNEQSDVKVKDEGFCCAFDADSHWLSRCSYALGSVVGERRQTLFHTPRGRRKTDKRNSRQNNHQFQ